MSLETINLEYLKLTANDKLLDLGCGEGRHALSAYISKELEVYAVDLSISDLEITKSRFNEFYESEKYVFDPEEIYILAIVSSEIDPAPKIISGKLTLQYFSSSLNTSQAKSPLFVNSRIFIPPL